MNALREEPISIQGPLPTPMLGLLHHPAENAKPTSLGVVIVNGGAQYRAGAHRLFVQLARHLAAQGHAVLRFDLPGQGDSPGEPVSFEDTAPHIGAAIDMLHQQLPLLQHTALAGLCDGASASLLFLHASNDPRITHLTLLNPWVHSETVRARTRLKHYYRQRLLMPDFWKKLLAGRIAWTALLDLARQVACSLRFPASPAYSVAFQDRMAKAWHAFDAPICLLLSGADQTAQEFLTHADQAETWHGWREHTHLQIHQLPHADHTCASPAAQALLLAYISKALKTDP